jgi:hypothetical protein
VGTAAAIQKACWSHITSGITIGGFTGCSADVSNVLPACANSLVEACRASTRPTSFQSSQPSSMAKVIFLRNDLALGLLCFFVEHPYRSFGDASGIPRSLSRDESKTTFAHSRRIKDHIHSFETNQRPHSLIRDESKTTFAHSRRIKDHIRSFGDASNIISIAHSLTRPFGDESNIPHRAALQQFEAL